MADIKVLLKDDYLIREKSESTEMYYLKDGTLGVYKIKGDQEVQIETIYSGEIVGEMSFLDKNPRSASVKALTDATVAVIPREQFDSFMESLPTWFKALINTLLQRLRKANARIKI